MPFLAVTRRRYESFEEADYTAERLESEAEAVRRLYASGVVRQIWIRGDVRGAVLLLECDGEADARGHIMSLPLFAAGMQELIQLTPLEPYRGFGPRV